MSQQRLKQHFRLWTVTLILVPSLIIMSLYTYRQISVERQNTLQLIGQRVDFQRMLIESWLDERAVNVRKISQMEAFRTLDAEEMQAILTLMQRDNRDFDSLSFIDREGVFQLSTLSTGIKFRSTVGQPYYEAARGGREYISDVVIGRNSGLPIINFSAPVYDRDGRFQGLVLGSVRTATIEMLLRKNWIGRTGEIVLANREGALIAEPRYVDVLVARGVIPGDSRMKVKLSDEVMHNIRTGLNDASSWNDYLGQKVIGAYRLIPDRNWYLVGSIGEEEIFGPIYSQLALMTASTLLVVLLLLPMAAFLTDKIKRPIEWLRRQSQMVAREEYESVGYEPFPENSPKELSELGDTFIAMSRKIANTVGLLKEQEAELQRFNSELEDIVERRTMELLASKERYETLLQQSAEAIVIVEGETGRVIEVNEAFSRMFGYAPEEALHRPATDLGLIDYRESERISRPLPAGYGWQTAVAAYEHRDGMRIIADSSGTVIDHLGKQLLVLSFRDITERQKLQAEIQEQVELAGIVQKSLLPPDYEDEALTIRTIFRPARLVSGDFYGYRPSRDGKRMHGFLLDVTGHGVATALHTSAISILLKDMMEEEDPWSMEALESFNQQMRDYFRDGSFAAVLTFTIDAARGELSYVSGGVNFSLMFVDGKPGKIAMPGIYYGIEKEPEFEKRVLPIGRGDTLYFMTDGLYERIPDDMIGSIGYFEETVMALKQIAESAGRDDCAALCIRIG